MASGFERTLRAFGLEGQVKSRLDLIDTIVAKGIPYGKVTVFERRSGITEKRLGELARVPARTWARRKSQGRFNPEETDRILRIGRLFEQAEEIFGTPEGARRWLEAPHRALGNKTPINLASTEVGAREVEDLLTRVEYGVYS